MSIESKIRLTRREAFKVFLVTAYGATATACSTPGKQTKTRPDAPLIPYVEPEPAKPSLEETELKETLEKRFNIRLGIIDQNDIPESHIDRNLSSVSFPDYWDKNRLQLLADFLPFLPEYFYEPKKNDEPLFIALGKTSSANEGKYDLIIGTLQFNKSNPEAAFQALTHEFIHLKDPTYPLNPPRIEAEKEIRKWSPWYDKLEEILGEKALAFGLKIRNQLRLNVFLLEDKSRKARLSAQEKEKLDFYIDLQYALGLRRNLTLDFDVDPNPSEFLPVFSEYYLAGKEYLNIFYGEFFPQSQIDQLYDFVKTEAFKGKEYKNFRPVS